MMKVPTVHSPARVGDDRGRPLSELSDSGLLWLINRVVFHPRGLSLYLHRTPDHEVVGWSLQGDGTDVHAFAEGVGEEFFRLACQTLDAVTRQK